MGAKTGIEWTDSTWNPFIGCSRVSEGCRHCYAETMAGRFSNSPQAAPIYQGLTQVANGHQVWTGKINQAPEGTRLKPLSWKKARRIFVNSMSDLFHENAETSWVDEVFAVMALCPQHTFQILTKRPERMLACLNSRAKSINYWEEAARKIGYSLQWESPFDGKNLGLCKFPLPNVWLGVSVESRKHLDRIDTLREVPAALRFLSLEPLIEDLGRINLSDIGWVIVGGESGPGARPMNPYWARSLRDHCRACSVPFFMKQMGSCYGANKGHELPADLNIKQYPSLGRA
jgi:protein gp37